MTDTPSAPPPAPPVTPKTRVWHIDWIVRGAAVVVALAIVVLFATEWDRWVGTASRQNTNDAYVRGDVTPLSVRVEGYVRDVPVTDFQSVKKGDLLIQIEDADYRARVALAEADLLAAQAAIENIKAHKSAQKAQVTDAEAAIAGTEADADRTRLEAERQRALLTSTYGTPQRVEQANAEARRFTATLASKRAELDVQRRQLAVLDTQELELRAAVKAKEAQLELARINLAFTTIAAPVGGVVSERGVRPGQYVHVGSQIISVVPLDTVWVVANFKETQLTHVVVGQQAEIRVDTYPGTVVKAKVESVAPASGAQFSLLPPDNATGNFTKVVQRIPVKLVLDAGNPLAGKLRPGMSVDATILTGK
jgi:membrane fusion protein (multidrug efflux system)